MSGPSNQRRVRSHQTVDHISSLPNTVLLHILSFVPTKSAVGTSILSKQWKYLWTNVPALDFTEMLHSEDCANLTRVQKFHFRNFVGKVLLLNDSSYLRHLHLLLFEDLFLGDHDLRVKAWLDTLSRRKICEICVTLKSTTKAMPIPLPRGFLSNEKLVVLKLDGPFAFEVPVSFHFPNLKIMHLSNIQLPNDEFMKSLTLGSPVLMELLIQNCYGISILYVESATLHTLKLQGIVKGSLSSDSFVVIKVPNLGYLHLSDLVNCYDICDPSSLEEVDLRLLDNEISFESLNKFSTVTRLYLEANIYDSSVTLNVSAVQTFRNLICLTLGCCSSILSAFLSCSPKLKSLVILFVQDCDTVDYTIVPDHFGCLEYVDLQAFYGRVDDVDFVEYFLRAGSVLKKMKIRFDCSSIVELGCDELSQEISQDLLELPRSSALCQIEISLRWPE